MVSIAEVYAAESPLIAPHVPSGTDFVEKLEGDCGLILGHLMGFIRKAFGVSPIEELVKPIVGDWNQLAAAKEGWKQAGLACEGVGKNFAAVPGQTTDSWKGDAGDAFRTRMTSLGESYSTYSEGCTLIGELTQGLIEMAQAVAEGIATVISFIGDIVEQLALEASVPVVGWIAGAADVAIHVKSFWDKIHRGYELLKMLLTRVKTVLTALQKVLIVLKVLSQVAKTMTVALKADTMATTDDAVDKTFGTSS